MLFVLSSRIYPLCISSYNEDFLNFRKDTRSGEAMLPDVKCVS